MQIESIRHGEVGLGRALPAQTEPPAPRRENIFQIYEANIGLFMAAIREDLGVCESMQRGFRSGANADVLFGRNEVGCDAYRRCVEEQLALSRAARAENGR